MSIKLPENLENTIGLRLIVNEQGFNEMLSLPRAIVYVSVNWSGQERVSRSIVYKALNDFKISEIPIFKIDCSEQEKKYVED